MTSHNIVSAAESASPISGRQWSVRRPPGIAGVHYDLLAGLTDTSACSSAYGLCDSEWELIDEDAA